MDCVMGCLMDYVLTSCRPPAGNDAPHQWRARKDGSSFSIAFEKAQGTA